MGWLGRNDVNTLIARKSYGKAIKVLEKQLRAEPTSVHLRQLLADVLVRDGQTIRGVEVLESLVAEFAADGFEAKAIALLKKIQRISPESNAGDKLAAMLGERHKPSKPAASATPPASANEVVQVPTGELTPADLLDDDDDPLNATSEITSADLWLAGKSDDEDFQWSPFLREFEREELAMLIGGLQLVIKSPGAIIFTEGEPGDGLYVLTTGKVWVYKLDDDGRNQLVAQLEEGDFFGEISLLAGSPRTATLTAATRCELLELDRETFETIAECYPRVRRLIMQRKEERLGRTPEQPTDEAEW